MKTLSAFTQMAEVFQMLALHPGRSQNSDYIAIAEKITKQYAHRKVKAYAYVPAMMTNRDDGVICFPSEPTTLAQIVTGSSYWVQELIQATGNCEVKVNIPNKYHVENISILEIKTAPNDITVQVFHNNTEQLRWTVSIAFHPEGADD